MFGKVFYSCQNSMKFEFSGRILEVYSNTKFYENPFSGSEVVPCGQRDGRPDKTKLKVHFRNFAKLQTAANKEPMKITFIRIHVS